MSFTEAVKICFRKYIDFSGRAGRSEYWWFFLFTVIARLVTVFIPYIGIAVSLSLLLPSLSVIVRRLHDTNRTGWWILLLVGVWLAGIIVGLIWPSTSSRFLVARIGARRGVDGRDNCGGSRWGNRCCRGSRISGGDCRIPRRAVFPDPARNYCRQPLRSDLVVAAGDGRPRLLGSRPIISAALAAGCLRRIYPESSGHDAVRRRAILPPMRRGTGGRRPVLHRLRQSTLGCRAFAPGGGSPRGPQSV